MSPPLRRIERAHCIELGRVVGIDEAREHFLHGADLSAFHFECAEPSCIGLGVRIAGVNYRFDATAQAKLISNHFRRLDDHAPSCPYFAPPDTEHTVSETGGQRLARALRRDLVEDFIPPSTLPAQTRMPASDPVSVIARKSKAKRRTRRDRFASTSSLARLVDTYRVLVSSQTPNSLREHVLLVRGIGVIPMSDYITPVYRAKRVPHPHVIYGGARWAKAYGRGFKLRFFDRISGVPVFLYVAASIMVEARRWEVELTHARAGGYVTAYVLGYPQRGPDYAAYTIDVRSAEHLVLRMPPARRQPHSATNIQGPPSPEVALQDHGNDVPPGNRRHE